MHLLHMLASRHLTDEDNNFVWKFNASGFFKVKSMYADFLNRHNVFLRTYIWKLKVPFKIKIFMWFLYKKVILTKDNRLAKRQWDGCKKWAFFSARSLLITYFLHTPLLILFVTTVYYAFNIAPPANVTNMFGNRLNGVENTKAKNLTRDL